MSHAFIADATLSAHIAEWQQDLGAIRRLAPLALEAYLRDLGQFLAFLNAHAGGTVSARDAEGATRRRYPRLPRRPPRRRPRARARWPVR